MPPLDWPAQALVAASLLLEELAAAVPVLLQLKVELAKATVLPVLPAALHLEA